MLNIEKQNIIVTGASGGIGNSIVEKLYNAGANILATGTNVEKLNSIKKRFDRINILPFDISNHDKIENFRRASSNIPKLALLSDKGLNVRDLILYDKIFIEEDSIPHISKRLS